MVSASPQEPVAWMYDGPDGQHYINEHRDTASQQLIGWGWTETPLYAFPQPDNRAALVEALGLAIEKAVWADNGIYWAMKGGAPFKKSTCDALANAALDALEAAKSATDAKGGEG